MRHASRRSPNEFTLLFVDRRPAREGGTSIGPKSPSLDIGASGKLNFSTLTTYRVCTTIVFSGLGVVMNGLKRAAVFSLALLVAGCASAPSYQKSVGDLSEAFSKMKTSFDAIAEDERQTFISLRTKRGLRKGYLIVIPAKCYQQENENTRGKPSPLDCRPQIVSTETGQVTTVEFKSIIPTAAKLVGLINDYGTGLVAITASKDVADLKDAVGKAAAAISKLPGDLPGARKSDAAGAISAFAVYAVGRILDTQRLAVLREIVNAANGPIANSATLLAGYTTRYKKLLIAQKSELLSLSNTQLERLRESNADPATIAAAADSLVANAIALQKFSETDVTGVFTKMRDAHAALLDSLNNPEVSPEEVFAQIGEFIDQLDKLKKGLEPPKGAT